MGKVFVASICCHGVLGGALKFDDNKLVFRTNKLTVPSELRRLEMSYNSIDKVTYGWKFCFPIVNIETPDNAYKFLVFNYKGFINEMGSYIPGYRISKS